MIAIIAITNVIEMSVTYLHQIIPAIQCAHYSITIRALLDIKTVDYGLAKLRHAYLPAYNVNGPNLPN